MGDLVRILVLLLLSPIWLPILRTIYEEMENALASEGGFLRSDDGRRRRSRKLTDAPRGLVHKPRFAHPETARRASPGEAVGIRSIARRGGFD